jgi:transposase
MRRMRRTTAEQEQVDHLFKTTNERRLRDRCQAVLMASRGRQRQTIAQAVGGHRTTVRLWRKHSHERDLEGLQSHWAPGQPRRMPAMVVPTLQAWVTAGPAGGGLDRANWTDAELATYGSQPLGIPVKRTARRDLCQRPDSRPYRPT